MDFTGSVGRIVEEPNEARAIQRQGPRHPPHTRHNLHHPPLHHHQVSIHSSTMLARILTYPLPSFDILGLSK